MSSWSGWVEILADNARAAMTAVGAAAATVGGGVEVPPVQTGDLVFHESTSSQSAALKLATGSRYTHVGVVQVRSDGPWVLEAVQPVRWTPLEAWIDRGVGDHAVVLRPKQTLSAAKADAVLQAGAQYVGRPYDLTFTWSDDTIYCSELVYKAYLDGAGLELAPLRTHADYDLSDPRLQAAIAERYPKGLPKDHPVVAPSDLLASELLIEVARVP